MDSSDDDDRENMRRILCPRPWLRSDRFEKYNDQEFKMRYRFSKLILDLIENNLTYLSYRNDPISPMLQLLIALRFYATGTFQMCVGDCFSVSKASVCRIIHKMTNLIAQLRPYFIRLPQNRNEINKIHNKFYDIAGFPNVLGAIDCTHIKIQSPGGEHGELYRNKKTWFSINTQVTCNADLKFMDIVARWPGSVHDSTIFNDSRMRMRLEAN
jgi:hypothetical protein